MAFHLNIGNWLAKPFRSRTRTSATRIAALMLLWQAANFSGFVYEQVVSTGYRPSAPSR
jgi:hypothetical protein